MSDEILKVKEIEAERITIKGRNGSEIILQHAGGGVGIWLRPPGAGTACVSLFAMTDEYGVAVYPNNFKSGAAPIALFVTEDGEGGIQFSTKDGEVRTMMASDVAKSSHGKLPIEGVYS